MSGPSRRVAGGWVEVYRGGCLEADVLAAVLEANGLHPIRNGANLSSSVFSGLVEDCAIAVPADEAGEGRRLVGEASGSD